MDNITKSLANNALAALTSKAPQGIVSAIKQASAKTGVNFAYMVQQAAAESSFNPAAKAKTSSASGLYQFIESTWMNMVDKHGAKHGIVTEGKSREEILRLRNNPEIAANMAAEFAGENKRFLDSHWGGEVGSTELYFAHFMGAGGAASFLKSRDENPLQEAALLFPKAAAANRNVFYDRESGQAKTLEEVYAFFDKKFAIEDVKLPEMDVQMAAFEAPHVEVNTTPANDPHPMSLVYARAPEVELAAQGFSSEAFNPYQSLIGNPIELMLLTQLELPFGSDHGTTRF